MAAQKMSTSTLILIISISAVILAGTGISIWLGVTYSPPVVDNDHPNQDWEFMITGNIVGDDFNITIQELLNMPQYEDDYEMKAVPPHETFTFTGVQLKHLFDNVISIDPTATTVTFIAQDGYAQVFTIADIGNNESNILAHSMDGEYLENYPEGGDGYLRLIMPASSPDDFNAQYCVKNVLELRFA
ncbi:MAG: molybdopterin-dependent oxidoreductase [Candidatus Heimdallarchaeota archaeon]